MDDFNNINNNEEKGTLSGFDSVDNGYTVTPDGGFYTKQKDEIIQDEVTPIEEKKNEAPLNEEPKPNYSQNAGYQYNNYNTQNPYRSPYRAPKPKKERRHGGGIVVLASVLAAVIGACSGAVITSAMLPTKTVIKENSGLKGNNVNINIDETAESVVEAVATKVTPSVVGIRTTTSVMNFFGGSSEATGDGSGVVYSSDGYIITNYHVISDAVSNRSGSKIEVYLDSLEAESYTANVVGYNISSDLAVIKIDVSGLTPVEFADSSSLKTGQYVITIGNPGGLEFMDSVTYGVISGLDRVVSADSGVKLIQTDAAINPGNSGGALVNTRGNLVGINSSKIVSEEFEGMGFAIPSNTVKEICENIIKKENEPEPYTGITISERYSADVLSFYGFPSGAVILSVADNSPAAKAGLQKGDIITEFNGTAIKEYNMYEELLKQSNPNDTVDIKIYRSGRYYSTNLTIGSNS